MAPCYAHAVGICLVVGEFLHRIVIVAVTRHRHAAVEAATQGAPVYAIFQFLEEQRIGRDIKSVLPCRKLLAQCEAHACRVPLVVVAVGHRCAVCHHIAAGIAHGHVPCRPMLESHVDSAVEINAEVCPLTLAVLHLRHGGTLLGLSRQRRILAKIEQVEVVKQDPGLSGSTFHTHSQAQPPVCYGSHRLLCQSAPVKHVVRNLLHPVGHITVVVKFLGIVSVPRCVGGKSVDIHHRHPLVAGEDITFRCLASVQVSVKTACAYIAVWGRGVYGLCAHGVLSVGETRQFLIHLHPFDAPHLPYAVAMVKVVAAYAVASPCTLPLHAALVGDRESGSIDSP